MASVEAWERLGRPYLAAYARWREAEARLAARGDRGQAAAALRSALDTAERLNADPLAREITALAGRARLTLDADEPEATPEEPDEGARLVHVSNILGKLGVAGRGEAAAVAYRLGLVEPASEPA
jgi:hypothetical protein